MAEIVFEKVSKRYQGVPVIEGFDLQVRDGELLVLVGPSGCGKSTLLRLLAGLEEITSGEIRLGGRRLNELDPQRRNLAMVFQNYALYPHMTVAQNLAFPLRMRRLPRREIERRVEETAALLGLQPLLTRRPAQLSGGQRQRVAMGRAIVREADAFLMDEPLSNLDAKLRGRIRGEIAALQARLGTTTLYVTHDQVEAMTLGHRVAVMRGGRLQQVADPATLYRHPANIFVAGFIGNPGMNLLRSRLEQRGGGLGVRLGGLPLSLPDSLLARHPGLSRRAGTEVLLGIRPERIALQGEGGALDARVESVEHLGHETLLHARVDLAVVTADAEPGVSAPDAPSLITAVVPGHRPLRPGTPLRLFLEADGISLFDPGGVSLLTGMAAGG